MNKAKEALRKHILENKEQTIVVLNCNLWVIL